MKKNLSRATALLGAALLAAPIMTFGGASLVTDAGAATTARLLTCTGKLSTKPSTYLLSCADANAGWTDMTWSGWGATSASGRGVLRQNDCTPNCASGKFINYRATVTLSHVINTKKYGELFSTAIFHYSVNGKAKTETFGLAD
jgi:V8-like Glu-specific endopeptidase